MEKTIRRINELAALSKERELSLEELEERQLLRRKYIDSFKASLTVQLDNVYFVETDGSKTKLKKKAQN